MAKVTPVHFIQHTPSRKREERLGPAIHLDDHKIGPQEALSFSSLLPKAFNVPEDGPGSDNRLTSKGELCMPWLEPRH